MKSQQKIINTLTICRKANKLILGFDSVKEAVIKNKASCILVMKDISENTLGEIKFFCKNCIEIIASEITSYDMLYAVGKKVVVAAVTDSGLADKIRELSDE